MKYVGAHVSASGGVYNAPINAMKLEKKLLLYFTKKSKTMDCKRVRYKTIDKWFKELEKVEFKQNIFCHMIVI